MLLTDLVAALSAEGLVVAAPQANPQLTGVADDSRKVTPGGLFCAVIGSAQDGHEFVPDAIARGAAALAVSGAVTATVPQVVVRDGRKAAAIAAALFYGRPADQLRLVGVTGTNGKSTTVQLIRHLCNADHTAGSLGTLGAVGPEAQVLPGTGTLTTPGPVELHQTLAALRDVGVQVLAMEASSHALHQGRVAGLALQAGVYTNLTHDHLDYHGDYDAYLAAKALLSDHIVDGGAEIVNADDPAWTQLAARPNLRRITFGVEQPADVRAEAVTYDGSGARFTMRLGGMTHAVTLPLLGAFNVSNALAASAAAWALGFPAAMVARRLSQAPQVAGRMERLAQRDWVVLRDYAHTPDALRRALEALRPLATGRLIVLFGAGGDRDRQKRPVMGEIAAQRADLAIVTSDNPRTEDPVRILDDIEAGMGSVAHLRIVDRRVAIQRALGLLAAGDVLLLAGKGHETYQVVGTEKRPFDEAEIVRGLLDT